MATLYRVSPIILNEHNVDVVRVLVPPWTSKGCGNPQAGSNSIKFRGAPAPCSFPTGSIGLERKRKIDQTGESQEPHPYKPKGAAPRKRHRIRLSLRMRHPPSVFSSLSLDSAAGRWCSLWPRLFFLTWRELTNHTTPVFHQVVTQMDRPWGAAPFGLEGCGFSGVGYAE
jgi:hypothetical protein